MTLKRFLKNVWLSVSTVRLIPHILLLHFHPSREFISKDIKRWSELSILAKRPERSMEIILSFIHLMTILPEYRNLFYYRLGWTSRILYPLCRPSSMLFISMVDEGIGPGLYIQHGWATSIAAKRLGTNCWINQHVTIGITNNGKPTIGNNVSIYAGAKVLGDINIGDNAVIGANAVVAKDVPENCTVVGVPAYIILRNGVKVKEAL